MAPRRPAQYFSPLYFLGDLSAVLHHFYIYSPLLTFTPTDGAATAVHHSYNSIKNPGANSYIPLTSSSCLCTLKKDALKIL